MIDKFQAKDDGLVELGEPKAQTMPPLRVGAKTMCIMKMLWAGGEACNDA
jgi:hypothetical protein